MRWLTILMLLMMHSAAGQQQAVESKGIRIAFYPEGGQLITGESCVIGFKATKENGQPVSLRCSITDGQKNNYGEAVTFHEGRGSFELLPEEGIVYSLTTILDSVQYSFPLPTHSKSGLALKISPDPKGFLFESIDRSTNGEERPAVILGQMQGRTVFEIDVPQDKKIFRGVISTASATIRSGIMRIIVLNKENKPLAERLAFVYRPLERLNTKTINNLLLEANWYIQTSEDSARQALELQMLTGDFNPALIQLLSSAASTPSDAIHPMDTVRDLREVIVSGKKKSSTEQMNEVYTKGFFSMGEVRTIDLVNGPDKIVHENIIEFLKFKVPGISVVDPNYENAPMPSLMDDPLNDPSGYRIYHRQQASMSSLGNVPMAIYLNEVQISPTVLATVPANDIVMIKVFSSFAPAPGGGAGGALAIYTKKPNQKKS